MSTSFTHSNPSDAYYLLTAKALSEDRRDPENKSIIPAPYPSLKKYRHRKKLTRYEKAAIARLAHDFEIIETLPNEQRPERLRHYVPPGRRKRTIESYLKAADKLSNVVPSLRKYKRRKKLKPSEKAAIAYKEKRLRHVHDLRTLPEKEFKKLKKQKRRIAFPIPGLQAIKLLNIEKDARLRVTDYGISASYKFETGVQRFYKLVYTGGNPDAMIEAAKKLLREGASSVSLWLNHGKAGPGFSKIERFVAEIPGKLDEESAAYMERAHGPSPTFQAGVYTSGGYAVLLDMEDAENIDPDELEIPFVYGVVGFFETRKGETVSDAKRRVLKLRPYLNSPAYEPE